MQIFSDPQNLDIFIKLSVALLLGMIIGVERLYAHKTASMRTYALVSMGAAVFVIISELTANMYSTFAGLSPTFMASQVIMGVGFLGAGLIIYHNSKLTGVTSATGLWVSAGVGMACGFGFFTLATMATFLILFIFTVLWIVEQKLKDLNIGEDNKD